MSSVILQLLLKVIMPVFKHYFDKNDLKACAGFLKITKIGIKATWLTGTQSEDESHFLPLVM